MKKKTLNNEIKTFLIIQTNVGGFRPANNLVLEITFK